MKPVMPTSYSGRSTFCSSQLTQPNSRTPSQTENEARDNFQYLKHSTDINSKICQAGNFAWVRSKELRMTQKQIAAVWSYAYEHCDDVCPSPPRNSKNYTEDVKHRTQNTDTPDSPIFVRFDCTSAVLFRLNTTPAVLFRLNTTPGVGLYSCTWTLRCFELCTVIWKILGQC